MPYSTSSATKKDHLSYGIHWFRRDLRIAGNPALRNNWKKNNGRVLGLFIFDSKFLARSDFSHNRFAFFLATLNALKKELRKQGSDLLLLDQSPQSGFEKLFEELKRLKLNLPSCVSINRDYEPFAQARDKSITQFLNKKYSINIIQERDHLLIEPHELKKPDGGTYQVFTPFAKKWFELFQTPEIQSRIQSQKESLTYLKNLERNSGSKTSSELFDLTWTELLTQKSTIPDESEKLFQTYTEKNSKHVTIQLPIAGSIAAIERLDLFRKNHPTYKDNRDYPALQNHTSGMSIYLKNGSFTTAQIIASLQLNSVHDQFFKEIVWREFYYHILYHHPRIENEAFIEKYKKIKWQNDPALFEAWKKGETGYPIIDAGMRELNQTGWMHNRVRMIVASFLTKDLLIDWKWGEKYFMEKLLDGDLAANNGGWQWASSTGCDPQPYFRIFNPTLQSKRFDPEGRYIRLYVPELKRLSAKDIHEPADLLLAAGYPDPIVNHSAQKLKTLSLYNV